VVGAAKRGEGGLEFAAAAPGQCTNLLYHAALLLGRLLLRHAGGLSGLSGRLGSGDLLHCLGLGGALDCRGGVDDGKNARLGMAGLRACSFTRHLDFGELTVCGNSSAHGTLERALLRRWTRLATRLALEWRNATAVARALRKFRSQAFELDLHCRDKDRVCFAVQKQVRWCEMR